MPSPIVERIRSILEAMATEGGDVDHEAARHGGIALMGTMGTMWLLRPDGTIWDVGDDVGRPLTPLADECPECDGLGWQMDSGGSRPTTLDGSRGVGSC